MDVVDDASLLFDCASERVSGGRGLVELRAKFLSGFLKILARTTEVAVGFTDDEAESGGYPALGFDVHTNEVAELNPERVPVIRVIFGFRPHQLQESLFAFVRN